MISAHRALVLTDAKCVSGALYNTLEEIKLVFVEYLSIMCLQVNF